jgi:hypothetical protein
MPEGIPFVARDVDPVAFALWRVSSTVHDCLGYTRQAGNRSSAALDRIAPVSPLGPDLTPGKRRHPGDSRDGDAASAARALLAEAREVAAAGAGDPATVTALEQLHRRAQALADEARGDSERATARFGS